MLATDPGTPGWPNEDFTAVAPGAAVLLDGATTVPRTADTGCVHGVAWYARTLGTALLSWPAAIDVVRDHGPAELIRQVRAAEDSDLDCERWSRDKPQDDATVVYWDCS